MQKSIIDFIINMILIVICAVCTVRNHGKSSPFSYPKRGVVKIVVCKARQKSTPSSLPALPSPLLWLRHWSTPHGPSIGESYQP